MYAVIKTKREAKEFIDSFAKINVESISDLEKLPHETVIYAVSDKKGKTAYVGKAKSMKSRWWAKNIEKVTHSTVEEYVSPNAPKYVSRNSVFWKPHKMLEYVLEEGYSLSYKKMTRLEAAHIELDLINLVKPKHNKRMS